MPEFSFADETVYRFEPLESKPEHAAQIRYVHAREGKGDKRRQAIDVPVTLRKDQSSRLRPRGSEEPAKLFRLPSARSLHLNERNKLDRAGAEPRFGAPKKDDKTEAAKKKDANALLSQILRVFLPDRQFVQTMQSVSKSNPSLTTPEVVQQARTDLGRDPTPTPVQINLQQFLNLDNSVKSVVLSQLEEEAIMRIYARINEERGSRGEPELEVPVKEHSLLLEEEGEEEEPTKDLPFGEPIQSGVPIEEKEEDPNVPEEERKEPTLREENANASRAAANIVFAKFAEKESVLTAIVLESVQKLVNEMEENKKTNEDFFRDLANGAFFSTSAEFDLLRTRVRRYLGASVNQVLPRDLLDLMLRLLTSSEGGEDELDKLEKLTLEFDSFFKKKGKGVRQAGEGTRRAGEGLRRVGEGTRQAGAGKQKRAPNAWVAHVKKLAQEKNISYKEALQMASRQRRTK